jgi:1-phosphatidylinositol-4-phosphate 5-kinase
MDPHDLLKLVRWRRKKKGSDRNQKKSYVKGKVIDGEHELYTLSIAVMIGVRTSISRTNTQIANHHRWVRPMDFRNVEKYEFRPKGDGPLPPHQLAHTFKFKDYSPVVFAYLRRNFGVNEFDFLLSVCGNANFIEFISNAKSGQFFFYSYDGRYMIKTMTNVESKFLRRILPQYFKHCCENPNTLITRFYGMYRVKLYHLRRNVKFVIMNSVYYTDKFLQTFYDLKGSVLGRDAKPEQAVLKDNDLRKNLPYDAIALPEQQRMKLRKQIEADCAFLKSMDIMDYSMLVGVHHIPLYDSKAVVPPLGSRGKGRPHRARIYSENSVSGKSENDYSESNAMSETPKSPSTAKRSDAAQSHYPSPLRMGVTTSDNCMRPKNHARTESDGSALAAHLFEDGLEEDDNSYLAGSEKHTRPTLPLNEETERKKQVTVEKLFWPFHRLYDIHGHRRVQPVPCLTCKAEECSCENDANDAKLLQDYKIPQFVPPLSDRKDGGLEMDVRGSQLPLKWKSSTNGIQQCEGKIFYMGIIDILQEYNSRKALESRYRKFQSAGRMAPSCVPPEEYGQRFLKFFDEYTQPEKDAAAKNVA